MYEEFYGFRDNPFRLTPDPDYLFLSTNHQEALGHLLFGVREGSGVVVITGEIGAGKTTLLRTLVRNLDESTIVAYIFNPALSAIELLQTINADLGLPSSSTSKKELIDDLNRFLLAQQSAKRRVVVIIDEAQDLEPSVLEQLRLLSNLETEREKLLQIVLVGQPELRDTLARPELAQLDQRVTLRWHLGPLDEEETADYVRHRIRVASEGREPVSFNAGALSTVYRIANGIPRVINILCHRALLIGYTREERRIDRTIILQAAKEIGREEPSSARKFPSLSFSPLLVGLLILLGTGVLVFSSTHGWLLQHEQSSTMPPLTELNQPAENAKEVSEQPASSEPATAAVATATIVPLGEEKVEDEPQSASPAPTQTIQTPTATISITAENPPPAVQPPQEGQELLQALQQLSLLDSAVQATNGLLHAWKTPPLQAGEWQDGAMDLGAIAHSRQLEYLPLNGSLNLLSLLDLPVILELTTPERHETRFVLMTGINSDQCRVLVDREYTTPLKTLSELWFGKAYLFWKDFERINAPLTLGSVGQQVRRLYMLLSQAPGIGPQLSANVRLDTFSQHTQEIVARFQKSKRLVPDGVVGPQTMISLYNTLPGYPHPSLNDAGSLSREGAERDARETKQTSQSSLEGWQRKTHEHNS